MSGEELMGDFPMIGEGARPPKSSFCGFWCFWWRMKLKFSIRRRRRLWRDKRVGRAAVVPQLDEGC